MALTPEDVVNKRFQPTKFREGYDQDEVDDFLDEVVAELRRLGAENDELRQRLASAESAAGDGQRDAAVAAPVASAPAPAPASVPEPASAPEPVLEKAEPVAAPEPVAPVAAAPAAVTPVPAFAGPSADETESTNSLLQLARRLHEEHVREGAEKRDALIAEGQSTAARVVAEAEARSAELVGDAENRSREVVADAEARSREVVGEAETKRREVLEQLNGERTGLERRIDDLRTFERDYRQKLKSYIEGQLHELDGEGASEPQPASAQGFGSN